MEAHRFSSPGRQAEPMSFNTGRGVQELLVPTEWKLIGSACLPGELLTAWCSLRIPVSEIEARAVEAHAFGPDDVPIKRQAVREMFQEFDHSRVVARIQTRALVRYAGVLWIGHDKVRRQAGVRKEPTPNRGGPGWPQR